MKISGSNISLAGIVVVLLLAGIVSADSDYCVPPTGLNVTVSTEGTWQNITINSGTCLVWTDNGYGNISSTACDNTAPAHIEKLAHTQTCENITWTWIDPTDADFDHVMIYQNGTFLHNVTAGVETDVWTGLAEGTSYTISTLTVDTTGNFDDTDWVNHTVSTPLCNLPPVANFTGTPLNVCMYTNVTFTDTSENTPTIWLWAFGDGEHSYLQNPSYYWISAGLFDISLKAGNAFGDNSTTKEDYVNVTDCNAVPVASFTSNVTCGNVNFSVQYYDTSTGGNFTDWYWDFGIGGNSTVQNPVVNYTVIGYHDVIHSVTNSKGTAWFNVSGYMAARAVGDACAAIPAGVQYDTNTYKPGWFNSWWI